MDMVSEGDRDGEDQVLPGSVVQVVHCTRALS